jgi:hypothetical protein
VTTTHGQVSQQLDADLAPHHAWPGAATPQAAPAQPSASTTSTRAGGRLVVYQHEPQCGDGAGVVTGLLHIGQLVPHRADQLSQVGSLSQPGHGLTRVAATYSAQVSLLPGRSRVRWHWSWASATARRVKYAHQVRPQADQPVVVIEAHIQSIVAPADDLALLV